MILFVDALWMINLLSNKDRVLDEMMFYKFDQSDAKNALDSHVFVQRLLALDRYKNGSKSEITTLHLYLKPKVN